MTSAVASIDRAPGRPSGTRNAIWDDTDGRWIAEAPFTGRTHTEHVTARLIVRRVRRLQPARQALERGRVVPVAEGLGGLGWRDRR